MKSEQAKAAQSIRKQLKAAFPGIKFSVTSKGYSGGNSVNANWENGPTYKMVMDIIEKYQYGSFNSMDDSYNYKSDRIETQGSSKYVFANRSINKDQQKLMVMDLCKMHNVEFENMFWYNIRIKDEYASTMIHRIMSKNAIPADKKIAGLERTECKCGMTEDFYRPILIDK